MFSVFKIKEEKKVLREQVKELRAHFTGEEMEKANVEMQTRLLLFPYFQSAESIFCYVSMDNEPSTGEILSTAFSSGKSVYVPRCLPGKERIMEAVEIHAWDDLKKGTMGILEPKKEIKGTDRKDFSLMLIPCLATDRRGGRLGHGAGYYDRFLEGAVGKKLCLCFDSLLFSKIPMGRQDIFMDYVLTEKELILCGKR
ncbi:5-formyltetrahydrofolate cyclo-ligase [Oribacterium sp. oral taxon 108]|uniref:5-formyltetrahydrofolate cyclo-ligase n=1 Tax=Oribacterium sp. oral taxon 108 TaxID=712414 RepID=UPI00020DD669|nr:5-formyltetrahydrofolate cyclo-ligase [Oribacterium sp. oral taxon 108]EGL37806.1 5-formyltetrahydrofolate cyclo-ligase [Oribacterium sp. oral taxon 108 str. F0425]